MSRVQLAARRLVGREAGWLAGFMTVRPCKVREGRLGHRPRVPDGEGGALDISATWARPPHPSPLSALSPGRLPLRSDHRDGLSRRGRGAPVPQPPGRGQEVPRVIPPRLLQGGAGLDHGYYRRTLESAESRAKHEARASQCCLASHFCAPSSIRTLAPPLYVFNFTNPNPALGLQLLL